MRKLTLCSLSNCITKKYQLVEYFVSIKLCGAYIQLYFSQCYVRMNRSSAGFTTLGQWFVRLLGMTHGMFEPFLHQGVQYRRGVVIIVFEFGYGQIAADRSVE